MRLGIDATNVGGGGGLTHLREILLHFNEDRYSDSISSVVIFASQKVLDHIVDFKILEKVTFPDLNGNLIKRIVFQLTKYDAEIKERCDFLFAVTGDYIGAFKPLVGMSRNMLLYERNIWWEIRQPKEVIRFWLNFRKQKRSFKNSRGIIFISQYAKNYVGRVLELQGKELTVINHGVSKRFSDSVKNRTLITDCSLDDPFRFVYVSPVHVYKHQWNVVRAVGALRALGYPVELHLVGGKVFAPAVKKLEKAISEVDPERLFIKDHGHIDYDHIDKMYGNAHAIIFASTCENMPNTLIESMASGSPIACSEKQPMPEFLKENGYYFDSYRVASIQAALTELLHHDKQNDIMVKNNIEELERYNWKKTSEETFDFLVEIYKTTK